MHFFLKFHRIFPLYSSCLDLKYKKITSEIAQSYADQMLSQIPNPKTYFSLIVQQSERVLFVYLLIFQSHWIAEKLKKDKTAEFFINGFSQIVSKMIQKSKNNNIILGLVFSTSHIQRIGELLPFHLVS